MQTNEETVNAQNQQPGASIQTAPSAQATAAAPIAPVPASQPKLVSMGKAIAISVICSLLVSASTAYVYHQKFSYKITKFDLKDYNDRLVAAVVSGKISQDEYRQRLKQALEKIVAAPKNTVVLASEIALKNVPEYIVSDLPPVPLEGIAQPQAPVSPLGQ